MLVRIGCSSWRRQHKDRPISSQALALPTGRVAGVFLLVTIMECVFDVDQSAISNLLVWDVAQSGGMLTSPTLATISAMSTFPWIEVSHEEISAL